MKLIELYPEALQKVNYDGMNPLNLALEGKQSENVIMKLIDIFPRWATIFIRMCGNCGIWSGLPLHYACITGQSEAVIRKLIELNPGALQEKDGNGKYPIHCAIFGETCNTVIGFIMDADPLAIARVGPLYTPLHLVAREPDKVELLEYLLERTGILVNVRDQDGQTPLHHACFRRRCEVVDKLLQHPDININARDKWNKTPLHQILTQIGISGEDLRSIQQLLEHPFILIDINNQDNETPFDIFKDKIKTLKSYVSSINTMTEHDVETITRRLDICCEIQDLLEEFQVKRRYLS